MKYDFDRVVDRRKTNSLKYDCAVARGKRADILPLWVADMDFRAPEEVLSALKRTAEHGIFGYSEPDGEYFQTLCDWFSSRHGWNPDAEKFTLTCGVVFSICALIRALTQPKDAVLICQPVYYPFAESVRANGRTLVVSELKYETGRYVVDFDDFERRITENNVRLFILCSPHNPVGRVWSKEELQQMGEICLRHGVFVIADEIHADFVYGENRHTVFSTVKPEFAQNCAVCTAPTKTFNLAGLHNANIYIENDAVRSKFLSELEAQGYSQSNVMGIVAAQAAYRYGADWLDQLLSYLEENISYVRHYLRENLPQIDLIEPQGTYLLWLDCRKLGLTDLQLKRLVQNDANVWLDDGYMFGAGGSGFQRVNIACPRSILRQALERIRDAVERYERNNG